MDHIHLIGIGGTGLSAIARVLFEQGFRVTGSDMEISPLAKGLMDLGIQVFEGHSEENVADANLVLRSSAIPDSNPEVLAAREAGIQVMKRRDFLPQLLGNKQVIAVAGTHGKTTTTSMIAFCMSELGCNPSFIVGSDVNGLGINARAGEGEAFVIEADEYDCMFLGISPDVLVITNIEHDHPDCFPTEKEYHNAFERLISQIKMGGTLILNEDDPSCKKLQTSVPAGINVITYGISPSAQYSLQGITHVANKGVRFSLRSGLTDNADTDTTVKLSIPGDHNALNACAAMIALKKVGVPWEKTASVIQRFTGSSRRFDIVGEKAGIIFIDDYGHHPTEIRATLAGARQKYPSKKIWVVWQPHTYSRTQQLEAEFTKAFKDCDYLIITEIYRSREPLQEYSARIIAENIDYTNVIFLPALDESIHYLKENLKSDSVLVVFSAGDAVRINSELVKFFSEKEGSAK